MHLEDDFGKGPLAQISAAWLNAVARFVNGFIGGFGIRVSKRDGLTVVSVDPDAIRSLLPSSLSAAPETNVDVSGKMTETYVGDDTPPVTATGDAPVWAAGGENGFIEDAIVAADRYNASGSIHRLWFVRKHYSADGRLVKVSPMSAADYVKV